MSLQLLARGRVCSQQAADKGLPCRVAVPLTQVPTHGLTTTPAPRSTRVAWSLQHQGTAQGAHSEGRGQLAGYWVRVLRRRYRVRASLVPNLPRKRSVRGSTVQLT